jgi:CheY-like chemotaxis protein/anti-sigma regulatory factor (Ser/Thr protein kinase)
MNLLTDLLDLSQIEAGQMRIETEEFDLDALLDQIAGWWQTAAVEKGLRLRIAKDQGLPSLIMSDKGRIQQVLNNFLGNAIKFTVEGRITLAIEEIAQTDQKRRIRFEVTDTGPGLTPAQTEQLFKPFVQVGADCSNERGGWGLGLSICHEIATAMNGTVGVTSRVGVGSTFFFEIDVMTRARSGTDTKAADPEHVPAEIGRHSVGLDILVAEDNPMSRTMMQQMLTELGHRVTTAPDGLSAVDAITDRPYDLVFMDVMMPRLDGVSATRRIRSTPVPQARTPIIGCSAYVDDVTRYRDAGMDEFLPKPVCRRKLQDLIHQFTPTAARDTRGDLQN